MAQIIVRKLEDDVKNRLRRRARRHGRSVEAEVRDILRNAVRGEAEEEQVGLGTRIAACFAGIGLDEELEMPPREEPRAATFDE